MNDGANRPVLVCDDESHILNVIVTKLRNAGFDVATAEDGAEGVERAIAGSPAVIVSDFQMPVLSGLEMARTLRARRETAAIPIVLVTARGFSLTREDLDGTNVKVVMAKPFSPREILETVQQLVADPSGATIRQNGRRLAPLDA
ncbi:MAG: response regulator [Phycisphaerae bacterium]